MTQPTFEEILKQAEELAWDEDATSIARSLSEYPKPPGPKHLTRYNQLIDNATRMLNERNRAIHELVKGWDA